MYGLKALQENNGFTNAQCEFVSWFVLGGFNLKFHSPSQSGGDCDEPRIRIPRTCIQLVWRTPGRLRCGDYDAFQDSPLLDAGVLLRWVFSRAQSVGHFFALLCNSERVRAWLVVPHCAC